MSLLRRLARRSAPARAPSAAAPAAAPAGDRGQPLRPEFLADDALFPFAGELAERLKAGS